MDYLEEVCRFLEARGREFRVVVMPDFFLDRLIELGYDEQTFCKDLGRVVRRKGGSIDGKRQTDLKGGNAVNTASALAALGVNVTPIVCTSSFGLRLLKTYLGPYKLDLTHVKIQADPSITTALEFKTTSGKANVMIRDVGALADFGPQNLELEEFEAIEQADYVCVFNWAGTRRHGTELAKTVFERVKANRRGKCYYDTADPTANKAEIPLLIEKVLRRDCIDVLSVNENEAVCYASQLSNDDRFGNDWISKEKAETSARLLASHLSARVDLHTTDFSTTFIGKRETTVLAFEVKALRATGAGDAWNAGNILGDAGGLSDEGRLTLANAVAAYFVSSPHATHPTREQLLDFCSKAKLRKLRQTR